MPSGADPPPGNNVSTRRVETHRTPWRTPSDRCCCCVPQCMDMRSGLLLLSSLEMVYGAAGVISALAYMIMGDSEAYITGTQVVLFFLDTYILALGMAGVLATHSRDKVQAFDAQTLRYTTWFYKMSVVGFLLSLLQMVVGVTFSSIAISQNEDLQADLSLHSGDNPSGAATFAWFVMINAIVWPLLMGYFTWIKWSYLEKLRHERRGVVLGLPVCRRLGDMDPQERYPTAQMAEVAGDGAADRGDSKV